MSRLLDSENGEPSARRWEEEGILEAGKRNLLAWRWEGASSVIPGRGIHQLSDGDEQAP